MDLKQCCAIAGSCCGCCVAAVLLATAALATPSCPSLAEARETGRGYPRYTYVHGKRCWYTNRSQLRALRRKEPPGPPPVPLPRPDPESPPVPTLSTAAPAAPLGLNPEENNPGLNLNPAVKPEFSGWS